MNFWRIAAATRTYRAEDLSGGGAAAHPGRWNDHGDAVVYAAASRALALLETAAYVDSARLPLNRYLLRLEIPEALWAAREEMDAASLPSTWDAVPAGQASVQVGTQWIAQRRSAILLLPSVIVPEEQIALVNPAHPHATRIGAIVERPIQYDGLFRDRLTR